MAQKGAGINFLETVTAYPKASAAIGIGAAVAFCTLSYFVYKRMEDTNIEIGDNFKSRPKYTFQKAGDVKGKLNTLANQESAKDTKLEVGNIESLEGTATLNQRMGYGK